MDYIFYTGIAGCIVLVLGAAAPAKPVAHPTQSTKNWLFAIGGFMMMVYSYLNYVNGGPIFFLILQILVNISSVLMMLNTDDKIDTAVLSLCGLGLIIWSLTLFEGYNTIFFILGLCGIGIGYALDTGTVKRNIMLTAGSVLIALFSYIEASWIFFWLNVFFALFSGYYVVKLKECEGSKGS